MEADNFIELALAQAEKNKKMTAKQQKIIGAAIKIFAEKGYAATSTSEIAKASGVAEGTIFRHYGTKENLLFSIILPTMVDSTLPLLANKLIQDVLKKPYANFEIFLRELIKDRFAFFEKNKEILKILIVEILHRDELRQQVLRFFETNVLQHLSRILDTCKQHGELIDLPNPTLIRLIVTSIAGFFMTRFFFLSDRQWDDPIEIENTVQYILHGIKKQG